MNQGFSIRLVLAAAAIALLGLRLHAADVFVANDASGNITVITAPPTTAPVILGQPRSIVSPTGKVVSWSARAAGAFPLTYQWQFNSNDLFGATADSFILTNVSSADFGAYRVVVSNPFGSVISSNALLQLDSDRDGLADAWETNFFSNIAARSGFQDYDQDGVSDLDEFVEGTHPRFASVVDPRLTIMSDNGEVFVTPNVPIFTNGQTVTLTGVPEPGYQFLDYLVGFSGAIFNLKTNPAQLRLTSSQTVRAIFGIPIAAALDVTNTWRLDEAGWFGQTNVTHDGIDAAQSARMLGASEAWMEVSNVVLSTEGTITFWWKVDGTPADRLRFYRNNLLRTGEIGGNTDWALRTYYLPAGNNVVRWVYRKNSDEVSEYIGLYYAPADAGWVDQVTYAPWPNPSIDSDGNGLPDIWEYRYLDTIGLDPNADADNDGISNRDEYLDGTDPSNNASYYPRLTVITSGGVVNRNPSLPKYTIGQSVALQAVPDQDNYFVLWAGAVSGTNTTNSVLMNRNQTIQAIFGLPLSLALDTPALAWTRGGAIGWYGQTNVSHDGMHAARSGPIAFRQESWMETSVTGPGTLSFWWKASSSTNNNYARFLIDGAEQPGKISGQTDWQPQVYYLGSGVHALRWTMTNNTAIVSLTNGAWVDQVQFTPGTTAPNILVQPTNQTVLQGSNVFLQVVASGTPPMTYQWYFNSSSLGPAGNSATLTLPNVTPGNSGPYYAILSNAAGTTNTDTVTLTVLAVPPSNDNFSSRATISGTNQVLAHNFNATSEPGEPDLGAGGFAAGSVWWKWTAPTTGRYALFAQSRGNSAALIAAIYTGTAFNNFVSVASKLQSPVQTNGEYYANLKLPFNAIAGTQYIIALAHQFNPGGYLALHLEPLLTPANDLFASRIVLSGLSASGSGSNENATYESGEPFGGFADGSVWWSWTAPRTGGAVVSSTGVGFAPFVSISTGSSVNTLTTLATGFPGAGNLTRVEFNATAGTAYQISLDSFTGTGGALQLNVAMTAPDVVVRGLAPDGSFQFTVSAPAGAHYEIQGSDDLINWTTLEPGTVPPSGTISYTDSATGLHKSRFYRVVLQ